MNITEVKATITEQIANNSFKPSTIKKQKDAEAVDLKEKPSEINSWQQDILLNAISYLENNKQVDNTHPLDQFAALPIETFEEALKELSQIHSDKFKKDALGAQANLKPEDILYLFIEE